MPNSRISRFYDSNGFAVLGMSRKKKNMGWFIYDGFLKAGAKVFAVHPAGGTVRNVEFHKSIRALPVQVEAAVLCHKMADSEDLLKDLKESGVRKIWLQQGSCHSSVKSKAENLGFETYSGCAMMFMPQSSFPHRLHRFFHDLFAKGKD